MKSEVLIFYITELEVSLSRRALDSITSTYYRIRYRDI